MIFGIGVDVLEARRMGETYARFGARIVERLLLPAERAQFERAKQPHRFLAMRFAAKEAIVKALGTGFAHGIWIRDIGVVQNAWGRPEVVYSARGDALRRKLGVGEGHVTLTDEAGLIVAVAVLLKADEPAGKRAAPQNKRLPVRRAPAKKRAKAAKRPRAKSRRRS
jgi:holo-[acyl-carrier protein] synthase